MIYAQFYQMSTGYVAGSKPPRFEESAKEPIPACGTDAVIILDGRYTLETNKGIAAYHCKKRGYIGYKLAKGESFTRSKDITEYAPTNNKA